MIEMLNMDCIEYMAGLPDGAFELAIVDPPYGIGFDGYTTNTKGNSKWANKTAHVYEKKNWDKSIPGELYFSELFRISKKQIIWGGNYFPLPQSSCWIIWDKKNDGKNQADCEMAWTSFTTATRMFRFLWDGMRQESISHKEFRIHPTQKPVALYKWLLSRYAKPGDKILDTHGGSGSICIACHDLGFDLTWMELDADYYKAACERYQNHAAQGALFEPEEIRQPKQAELI